MLERFGSLAAKTHWPVPDLVRMFPEDALERLAEFSRCLTKIEADEYRRQMKR